MPKFRKKPVVIDAWQFTVDPDKPLIAGTMFIQWPILKDALGYHLLIQTLESQTFRVNNGDWVIRGVKGEFYACKPDIFEMTYDPVVATAAPQEAGANR